MLTFRLKYSLKKTVNINLQKKKNNKEGNSYTVNSLGQKLFSCYCL